MTDLPDFSMLAGRFLNRVGDGLTAARAALRAGSHDTLRRELHSLFTAAGMFGYQDIAQLAQRAESLCELRPLPETIVADLLDAIEDANCTHRMMSGAGDSGALAMPGA